MACVFKSNLKTAMKFNTQSINQLEKRIRTRLINSLSGFKSANLIGTCDGLKQTNLAIFSSVVHLGSEPPLLALISRPQSVARHTLQNIINTGYFTINHVNTDIFKQAHQTSARYPFGHSEFDKVGLTPLWESDFPAPFVNESRIRLGMTFREKVHLAINDTELIIGEISYIQFPDNLFHEDGYVNLEKADTVAISSLDSYHSTQLLSHLSYAKPNQGIKTVFRKKLYNP